jgi:outer membrane receptor protein involved in Fe transport
MMCLNQMELSVLLRCIKFWTHSALISRIITHIEDLFMRRTRIRVLFSASLLAATGLAGAPASAQQPYDGLWHVTVVTKTGSCDAQSTSTLTVTEGKVSAAGAPISGSVGSGGLVRVSINGAYANGQLSGNSGSGKWNGASGGIPCSGRWEASRQ